jgi:flagellar hook assembly protein FlgD
MQRVLNWLRGTSDVPEWEEEFVNRPREIHLSQNHPNPFNPSTSIQYSVYGRQRPAHTTLRVFNIIGRLVRTLVDEEKLPGAYSVTWDGKDEKGDQVSSGVYFYQLKAREQTETKKMVLLR